MSAAHRKGPANGPPLFAKLIAGLMVAVGAGLLVLPPPNGIEPNALRALGLVFIAVAFWATEVLPPHVTSFLFFLLAVVLHVAEPVVVFSGFHAGAVWLIFGGIVLGVAVQRTVSASAWRKRCCSERDTPIDGCCWAWHWPPSASPSSCRRR